MTVSSLVYLPTFIITTRATWCHSHQWYGADGWPQPRVAQGSKKPAEFAAISLQFMTPMIPTGIPPGNRDCSWFKGETSEDMCHVMRLARSPRSPKKTDDMKTNVDIGCIYVSWYKLDCRWTPPHMRNYEDITGSPLQVMIPPFWMQMNWQWESGFHHYRSKPREKNDSFTMDF